MRLLNASGCLDALTAPEVARSLDAFVTKTVTPLPREGNEPVRIAEVEGGMLNAIGLANPGIDRFVAETLPKLGGLDVWVTNRSMPGFARPIAFSIPPSTSAIRVGSLPSRGSGVTVLVT